MSAPLGSIRTWSDMQLMEDVNDKDSISAVKYNKRQRRAKARKEEAEWRAHEEAECRQAEEQRRLEVERRAAEEQAKRQVSHFWFVMTELMVLGGGGCCATAQEGQGEGVGAAGVQPLRGAWARVRTWAW